MTRHDDLVRGVGWAALNKVARSRNFLGSDMTSEAIRGTADHHGASPLAVSGHLTDHHVIPSADVLPN